MKRSMNIGLAAVICVAFAADLACAQVSVINTEATRLVTEPSGARDDNNGGADGSTLIGINTGLVDNFMVYEMDLSALAGFQTSGATATITINGGFSNANHGSTADTIVMNRLFNTNDGYIPGEMIITGDDTPANDGSISFLNRVQFDGGGTTEPWLDESGAAVANLLGAIDPVSSAPGYDAGMAPPTIDFPIDAATAQNMIDNGIAGIVFQTTDDGNDRSRFFLGALDGTTVLTITFEPGGGGGFVAPDSFTLFRGIAISEMLSDFESSDDVRARYNPGFTINNDEAPVWLIFDGIAANAVEFSVESQAGTPGLTYTVEAFDYSVGALVVIGTQAESFGADQVTTFALTADNIDSGGDVQTRVGWRQTGFTINFPWEVQVDQVGWIQ